MWEPQGIYTDYLAAQPAILFGEKALWGLASLPGARIVVIGADGHSETVRDTLTRIFAKRALYFVKRSWQGEPDLAGLKGTVSELEHLAPDVLVAVGGGAVLDGAKLCRLFYEFPWFTPGQTRLQQLPFKTRFVAVPTTVGSGAEISSAAVYLSADHGRKQVVVSRALRPCAVVLDPALVKTAPEKIVLSSALDAAAHIIEGFVSLRRCAPAECYAGPALSILYCELRKENTQRDWQRLQWAGYLGGLIQDQCVVGAAHAVAHQLTAFGFSHSEAVALLLPAVIRANAEDARAKALYAALCESAGIPGAEGLLAFLEKTCARAGIAARKQELREVLQTLLRGETFAENARQDPAGQGNPVPITRAYLEKLAGELV